MKYYVLINEWAKDYEKGIGIVAVRHNFASIKEVFDKALPDEMRFAEENGWEIEANGDDRFEAGQIGYWSNNHVSLYIDTVQRDGNLPIVKGDTVKVALDLYGKEKQVDMAIEKMSELTKALLKERRNGFGTEKYAEAHANIIEEIADVAIMLSQLIEHFDKDNEIQAETDYKIARLEQRLGIFVEKSEEAAE